MPSIIFLNEIDVEDNFSIVIAATDKGEVKIFPAFTYSGNFVKIPSSDFQKKFVKILNGEKLV